MLSEREREEEERLWCMSVDEIRKEKKEEENKNNEINKE